MSNRNAINIIQLIKSVGTNPIEQAMLANALLNPSNQASQDFMNALSQNPLNLNYFAHLQ